VQSAKDNETPSVETIRKAVMLYACRQRKRALTCGGIGPLFVFLTVLCLRTDFNRLSLWFATASSLIAAVFFFWAGYTYWLSCQTLTQYGLSRERKRICNLLPAKVRNETFEPAYNDAQADHLMRLRKCKSKRAQRFLKLCFSLHVALMVGQCLFWYAVDSVRRAARTLK
jgi:hypothetical protein